MNGLSLLLFGLAVVFWAIGYQLSGVVFGYVFHGREVPVYLAAAALVVTSAFPVCVVCAAGVEDSVRKGNRNVTRVANHRMINYLVNSLTSWFSSDTPSSADRSL